MRGIGRTKGSDAINDTAQKGETLTADEEKTNEKKPLSAKRSRQVFDYGIKHEQKQ